MNVLWGSKENCDISYIVYPISLSKNDWAQTVRDLKPMADCHPDLNADIRYKHSLCWPAITLRSRVWMLKSIPAGTSVFSWGSSKLTPRAQRMDAALQDLLFRGA